MVTPVFGRLLGDICNRIRIDTARFGVRSFNPKLPPNLCSTLKCLKQDRSIIIYKAGKGDVTVVMDVKRLHFSGMEPS